MQAIWVLIIPLVTLLALIWPALWMWKRGIIGLPRVKGRCYRCGYDLVGVSPNSLCPECGAVVLARGDRPRMGAGARWLRVALALVFTAVICTVGSPLVAWARMMVQRAGQLQSGQVDRARKGIIAGTATSAEIERAVRGVLRQPEKDWTGKGAFGTGAERFEGEVIRRNHTSPDLEAIASVLDDRSLPAERLTPLLEAIARSYIRIDITETTPIDDALLRLFVADDGMARSIRSGPPPRAIEPKARRAIIEALLAIQGRADRAWSRMWSAVLEQCALDGTLSPEEIALYADQAFDPKMVMDDEPDSYAGDFTRLFASGGWKMSSFIPVRIRCAPVDAFWRDRAVGRRARIGDLTTTGYPMPAQAIWLALPDEIGAREVEFEVSATFGPRVVVELGAISSRGSDERATRLSTVIGDRTVTRRASVRITTRASTFPMVREQEGPTPRFPSWDRGATVLYTPVESGALVRSGVGWGTPERAFAAEVLLRQKGVEHRLGWAISPAFETRIDNPGVVEAFVPGFDPGAPSQIVYRSTPGPLARPALVPVIWKGEFELTVHKFRRADEIRRPGE